MRIARLLGLAVVPFLCFGSPAITQGVVIPGPAELPREPVLAFDISGFSLGGPIFQHLSVYNDGQGMLATAGFDGAGEVYVGVPGPNAVRKLAKDLALAGAFQLTDQLQFVSDLPLTTVTVFRGTTEATAHTYSYWSAEGPYAAPAQLIADFIAAHFTPVAGG